jgi:hypothetical protein
MPKISLKREMRRWFAKFSSSFLFSEEVDAGSGRFSRGPDAL